VVDRSLLEWLDDQLRAGRHFVSNVQVLSSYYSEARAFFTHTFRVESFPALLLPFGTPAPAISGTACFAKAGWTQCGGYDPRVNEAGYGWDEYEFFLRYLNPAIVAEQRTDRSADATKTALDAGIRQTATFPLNAFRAIENQTEEKHASIADGHTTTLEGNKIFIRDFFATAATRIQQVADTAVTTLVFSDRSTSAAPRARGSTGGFRSGMAAHCATPTIGKRGLPGLGKVFDDRRSLPRGLGAWCRPLFEASAADRNRGRLSRLLQEMREIIAFAAIHPERGADAYCRLAEMAAEAHQPNAAEGFLRDAVALHPGHPLATPRLASLLWQRLAHTSTIDRQATLRDETMALLRSMTDRSPLTRYNRASLAKTLGQADEARANLWFLEPAPAVRRWCALPPRRSRAGRGTCAAGRTVLSTLPDASTAAPGSSAAPGIDSAPTRLTPCARRRESARVNSHVYENASLFPSSSPTTTTRATCRPP
jgi:hypothetical protein